MDSKDSETPKHPLLEKNNYAQGNTKSKPEVSPEVLVLSL